MLIQIERLYNFEVFVEELISKNANSSAHPALMFRFLNFPAIVLKGDAPQPADQSENVQDDGNVLRPLRNAGIWVMRRGKSAAFRLSAENLAKALRACPLLVSLVDLASSGGTENKAVLLGSAVVDLGPFARDVESLRGPLPGLAGFRTGVFRLHDLVGNETGAVHLSTRLVCREPIPHHLLPPDEAPAPAAAGPAVKPDAEAPEGGDRRPPALYYEGQAARSAGPASAGVGPAAKSASPKREPRPAPAGPRPIPPVSALLPELRRALEGQRRPPRGAPGQPPRPDNLFFEQPHVEDDECEVQPVGDALFGHVADQPSSPSPERGPPSPSQRPPTRRGGRGLSVRSPQRTSWATDSRGSLRSPSVSPTPSRSRPGPRSVPATPTPHPHTPARSFPRPAPSPAAAAPQPPPVPAELELEGAQVEGEPVVIVSPSPAAGSAAPASPARGRRPTPPREAWAPPYELEGPRGARGPGAPSGRRRRSGAAGAAAGRRRSSTRAPPLPRRTPASRGAAAARLARARRPARTLLAAAVPYAGGEEGGASSRRQAGAVESAQRITRTQVLRAAAAREREEAARALERRLWPRPKAWRRPPGRAEASFASEAAAEPEEDAERPRTAPARRAEPPGRLRSRSGGGRRRRPRGGARRPRRTRRARRRGRAAQTADPPGVRVAPPAPRLRGRQPSPPPEAPSPPPPAPELPPQEALIVEDRVDLQEFFRYNTADVLRGILETAPAAEIPVSPPEMSLFLEHVNLVQQVAHSYQKICALAQARLALQSRPPAPASNPGPAAPTSQPAS
eukprot:tig00000128_g7226.t1